MAPTRTKFGAFCTFPEHYVTRSRHLVVTITNWENGWNYPLRQLPAVKPSTMTSLHLRWRAQLPLVFRSCSDVIYVSMKSWHFFILALSAIVVDFTNITNLSRETRRNPGKTPISNRKSAHLKVQSQDYKYLFTYVRTYLRSEIINLHLRVLNNFFTSTDSFIRFQHALFAKAVLFIYWINIIS